MNGWPMNGADDDCPEPDAWHSGRVCSDASSVAGDKLCMSITGPSVEKVSQ